jgi:LysM repeat protein
VVTNDTCVGLAFRYNVSVRSIIELNNLTPECLLSVGQTLYLPQPTPTASPPPTSTLSPAEATEAACEKVTYTVQADDTLGAIASNYAVDMQAIISYNGMSGPNIFSGQILIIPLCARQPTAGPSPTATPPPPYPAPNLLLPQDGAAYSLADNSVSLQWASVGVLRENEVYKVTVEDVTEGSGTRTIVEYVSDTKFIVSAAMRPSESTPHVIRWWIQVVRKTSTSSTGQAQYETAGAASSRRVFTWSGAAVPVTPTP